MNELGFGNSSSHPLVSNFFQTMSEEERKSAHMVFCVVSAKGLRVPSGHTVNVKKISLNDLLKVAKFDKYVQEHRLVIAIEKGDQVFASISDNMAQELEQRGLQLAVNGKGIDNVEVINPDDYLNDLTQIKEALKSLEVLETKGKRAEESRHLYKESHQAPLLAPSDVQVLHMLLRMEGIPDKIKQRIIQRMLENQRQVEREREEQYEKDRLKASDIKKREIDRSILKDEIKRSEIKEQNTTIELTQSDTEKNRENRIEIREDNNLTP